MGPTGPEIAQRTHGGWESTGTRTSTEWKSSPTLGRGKAGKDPESSATLIASILTSPLRI